MGSLSLRSLEAFKLKRCRAGGGLIPICPETHLFLPCSSDSFRLAWCHKALPRSLDEEEDALP